MSQYGSSLTHIIRTTLANLPPVPWFPHLPLPGELWVKWRVWRAESDACPAAPAPAAPQEHSHGGLPTLHAVRVTEGRRLWGVQLLRRCWPLMTGKRSRCKWKGGVMACVKHDSVFRRRGVCAYVPPVKYSYLYNIYLCAYVLYDRIYIYSI